MGKNHKEISAYHYLHDIGNMTKNMLIKLKKKWNRHNFDVGEYRSNSVKKKQEIFDDDWKNELKDK